MVLSCLDAKAETSATVYDLSLAYENPIRSGAVASDTCFEFVRVSRNVAPLVNHIFLIALEKSFHSELPNPNSFVFGASKGASDLAYFRREFSNRYQNPDRFRTIGYACAGEASQALDELSRVGLEWQERLKSSWYFLSRMLVTPLMGRLCEVASLEAIAAIGPHLYSEQNDPPPQINWDFFSYR